MKYLELLSSRRVLISLAGAVIPIISKEVFGYEMTADQVYSIAGIVIGLVVSLGSRDHVVTPVGPK